MASQQSGAAGWRQITVVIRSDILDAAKARGIDISSECNRALAARTGTDFSQQKIPVPGENPVIIAQEGADSRRPHAGAAGKQIPPVLNAEDPSARDHLKRMKKERPAPEKATSLPAAAGTPGEHPGAVPEKPLPAPAQETRREGKGRGKAADRKKAGKDDLVRRFVSHQVLRTGSGEQDRIRKDELYQIFARWWKENAGRNAAVPDKRAFTVALKNRCAMEEIVLDGTGYWNGVKLK